MKVPVLILAFFLVSVPALAERVVFHDSYPDTRALEIWQLTDDPSTKYHSMYHNMMLGGKTPNEVYEGRFPANRKPRIEPRPRWPRGSPCAKPWALVGGKPGRQFNTTVTFQVKRAA